MGSPRRADRAARPSISQVLALRRPTDGRTPHAVAALRFRGPDAPVSLPIPAVLRRALLLALAFFVLVAAIELLKRGASGLGPVLDAIGARGSAGALGFGWLLACVLLSGSPAAAIALTLLASGSLTAAECLAMIVGSRLGASFVVLLVGLADDVRHGRTEKRSAYVGVAALLVTASVYLPVLAIGLYGLEAGWLAGLRFEGRALASFVDLLWGRPIRTIAEWVPGVVLFVLGAGALLGSLRLFDAVLPDLKEGSRSAGLRPGATYRPSVMFAFGLLVTALTLSVAVSISILVPLAAKGYVRRENLLPYILGANITTFVDTVFAGALVGHPDAVRVVVLIAGWVAILSLPLVFVAPYAYERVIDRWARRITASTRSIVAFVAVLVGTPLTLLLVSRLAS